jgi:hypothetical protein
MTNAYNPGSRFRLSSRFDRRIDPMTGSPGRTSRAAQIMFGSDASTTSGGLPPDRQG